MPQYSKILVGVSVEFADGPGSATVPPDCRNAAERAITLARREGAQIEFAHTFAVSPTARDRFRSAQKKAAAEIEESSRRRLQELVDLATEVGVNAEYAFLFGKPWVEIPEAAERGGFDLIVVGSRQHRGFKRALFGSVAARVMLRASRPVLVVRGNPKCDFERVVIATDLSETGAKIVRHGLAVAKDLRCETEVVHGVDNWYEDQWHRAGFAREVVEREHEEEKAHTREKLEAQLEAMAAEMEVPVPKVRVETGALRVMRSAMRDGDTDLLVIGVVGRSGFERVWIGDTAERVLPEIPCSLLAIKLTAANQ